MYSVCVPLSNSEHVPGLGVVALKIGSSWSTVVATVEGSEVFKS